MLPRLEKGVFLHITRWTHPARIAVFPLVATGSVSISRNTATGRAKRRHLLSCWASSKRSHIVSSTPCHGAWTSVPLSVHLSTECKCTTSQIEKPICTRRTANHQFIWQQQKCGALGGMEYRVVGQHIRDSVISSPTSAPPRGMALPRTAWIRLNRLCTGLGRFRSCLYKWDTASSAACECVAKEQTSDHVVLECPIHRPPHCTARLDGSGGCDNRMAAQHLPRDLCAAEQWIKKTG